MSGHIVTVAHTGITVSDIDRALAFFGTVLGGDVTIPVLYTDPIFERVTGVAGAQIRIAYVELPGHTLELLQYVRPEDRRTSDLRPCDPGHLHLSLRVDGITDLVERMADTGFHPVGSIQHSRDGDAEFDVIYTYGFDGLVIELMDFGDQSEKQSA